jgi:outer membrane protein assembly factor BamA
MRVAPYVSLIPSLSLHFFPPLNMALILYFLCMFIQSITARSLNTLGRAETLTANLSFGTTTKKSFNSTFSMPVWNTDLLTRLEVQAFGMQRDYRRWASCEEEGGGLRVGVKVCMEFCLFFSYYMGVDESL